MSIESEVIELIADELKGWHEIELLESKVEDMQDNVSSTESRIEELRFDFENQESVEHWQIEEVESTVTDLAEDVRKLEQLKTDSESEIQRLVDKRMAELLMEMQLSISSVRLSIVDGDNPSDDLGPNSLPPVEVSE